MTQDGLTDRFSLLVQVVAMTDLDDEQIYSKTESLRREIIASRVVDRVERAKSQDVLPPGAKAAEVFTLGALLLTLAPVAVQEVLIMVREWLSRNRNLRILLTVKDATLEVSAGNLADFERMVAQVSAMRSVLETKHG